MAALRKNMQMLKKLHNVCSCYCNPTSLKHFRTSAAVYTQGDPLPYFMRDDVQTILKRITGYNPLRTFYRRKLKDAENPSYQALTDEELKEELEAKKHIKDQRLQMPPFMDVRKPRDILLSDDPDIAPVLTSIYVFIDISSDSKRIQVDAERPVLCRHEDGKLKMADWPTTDRVIQMYLPLDGRQFFMPKMFEEEHLEKLLEEEKHLYVLERACIQFEPDCSEFIRVSHRVYEDIAQHRSFDLIQYTRFFGPMAFYLAWHNKIEPLVVEMINKDSLIDAVDLINLKCIVHKQPVKEGDIFKIIRDYCLHESKKQYLEELKVALDNLDKRLEMKAKMQQREEMRS